MEVTWWTQPEQLDAQQRKVVALPMAGDHLIIGPPGSGKTNLLILRATFLHGAKVHDTVVLTFGRVLREFLATGTKYYPFDERKIQTFVKWGAQILKENGVQFAETGTFQEIRESIVEKLKDLVKKSQIGEMYDCILIDEAQDYSADEISVIRSLAKKTFSVGDDRQRIYSKKGGIEALKAVCTVTKLKYHYRNGLKICRVADGIMDLVDSPAGLEASSQYVEAEYPSSVKDMDGLTIEQQVDAAIPEIETQLRAYPDGIIGLLCPRHAELDAVIDRLEKSQLAGDIQVQRRTEGYVAFAPERRVIVTTLHSAKGLEFRALHLLGMDMVRNFQAAQKRMSFTGVTRAKTSLSIYHQSSLPGHLERGLAAISPETGPPDLNDLFLGAS